MALFGSYVSFFLCCWFSFVFLALELCLWWFGFESLKFKRLK
uniref:ATP synthase F0 subunit 8 n=1 Tax=Perumytilus purpuratus TaxID=390823 RepID=A0A346KL09_PERPP|nr:ATP synthase F0 subunit 8 [Perumytilus purpuratus]AXP84514.1 ATP synthase F0 subunit 8 [Perumytilus purpuratus]AXP84527.1 ATP synthase F0 subunit 8 [Perumytilus purpuratus]